MWDDLIENFKYNLGNTIVKWIIILLVTILVLYSFIGTAGDVEKIKVRASIEIPTIRNWKILRYEGFQYGSWGNHGGKVWYHVQNIDNPNIQYRIFVTIWNNELQYHYNEPEILNRLDIEIKK